MKKIVSILIAGSMAAAAIPCTAFAEGEMVAQPFTYEQNFDSFADGTTPDGFKLYRNASSNMGSLIKATVQNGALAVSDNNTWSNGYVIFDIPELQDVNSQDLTMECDITYGNTHGYNTFVAGGSAPQGAGFAYAFDETVIDSTKVAIDDNGINIVSGGVPGVAANRVYLHTAQGDTVTNQYVTMEEARIKDGTNQVKSETDKTFTTVNKLNTETGTTVHLSMTVNNTKYEPIVSLNGEKSGWTRQMLAPIRTSGKVGLFVRASFVTIDNIKITGTRNVPADSIDSLTVGDTAYDAQAKTLTVPVKAVDADAAAGAQPTVLAAVYDDNDKLVSVAVQDVAVADGAASAVFDGTVTVSNVEAAPAAGKVKVFFWDMSNCSAVINSITK